MIRLHKAAEVYQAQYACINLIIQIAEKILGVDAVKKELTASKVLFNEFFEEDHRTHFVDF